MKIVAIGGVGYVGVNVLPYLASRHSVVAVYRGVLGGGFRAEAASVLERCGVELHRSQEVVREDDLARLSGDVYLHLAGKISGSYRHQWQSHVGLLRVEIGVASEIGSRVVYTSSTLAFGRVENLTPGSRVFEEEKHLSGRRVWRCHHSRTKAEGEKLLVSKGGELGGRFSIVRPGLVVGSHAYHKEWTSLVRLARLGLYPRMDWTLNYVSSTTLSKVFLDAVEGRLDGKWVHAVSYHEEHSRVAKFLCESLRGGHCRGVPLGFLMRVAGTLAPPWSSLSAMWEGISNSYIFQSRHVTYRDRNIHELAEKLVSWALEGSPGELC